MKNDTYEITNGKSFRGGRVVATDHKFTGEEPTWENSEKWSQEKFESTRARALRFYNYYLSPNELKTSLQQWMKLSGHYVAQDMQDILKAPSYIPSTVVSKLARCILRGMPAARIIQPHSGLTDHDFIRAGVNQALGSIRAGEYTDSDSDAPTLKSEQASSPLPTIADRIFLKVDKAILTKLDDMLDSWIVDKTSLVTIKLHDLLQKNEISQPACVHVSNWIQQVLSEMTEAQSGKDDQLTEAYSHLSKRTMKARIEILENLKNLDLLKYTGGLKSKRVPRAKRTVSAEKQVQRMKFMESSAKYQVTSASPVTIPGSKQLYVFNTKYRTLSVYLADGPSGLAVKGSTVQGYNTNTSTCQSIRKPEDILPIVLGKAMQQIAKALLTMVTTKSRVPNGRINSDAIILRVIQ